MNQGKAHPLSVVLVLIGLVLGVLVSVALYQWESGTRATPASETVAAPAGQGASPAPAVASTPQAAVETAKAAGLERGKTAFEQLCAGCHPGGGKGVGPTLKGPGFTEVYSSDEALAEITRSGKGGMFGFDQNRLDDATLKDLIAYIRSLR